MGFSEFKNSIKWAKTFERSSGRERCRELYSLAVKPMASLHASDGGRNDLLANSTLKFSSPLSLEQRLRSALGAGFMNGAATDGSGSSIGHPSGRSTRPERVLYLFPDKEAPFRRVVDVANIVRHLRAESVTIGQWTFPINEFSTGASSQGGEP